MTRTSDRVGLLAFALGYPEAALAHPWGEDVVKVRGKVFVFFGVAGPELGLGVKLPESGVFALSQPFATPSGYGLGRAGWVSARFGPREAVPLDVLRDWIDESYRAVAPRSLAKTLPPWIEPR